MTRVALPLVTCLGALLLTGCLAGGGGREASRDGTADLVNGTDRDDPRVVVLDDRGTERYAASLDPVFRLDTQDPRRDRQCLVGPDGRLTWPR